jgi:hypothetical protein
MRSRLGAGVVARVAVVAVFATGAAACGEDDSGHGSGNSAVTTAPTHGTSGDQPAGDASFDTVFDEDRLKLALPDPPAMGGWVPKAASAQTEEPANSSDCGGADADWDCAAIASGRAKYEAEGEYANFNIRAFASQKAAQDACAKESATFAKHTKADVAPVAGTTSHAYYRNGGGLDGIYLTMCLGTVVAKTSLEGGSMDPSTLHRAAGTFADRIKKAAAAA